jgi:amino acid transporter
VIGLISIICAFLPLLTVIDALLVTRILVQFIGQIFAVILLRRSAPQMERPFRMWLYPLPCLVAVLGWTFIFVTLTRS